MATERGERLFLSIRLKVLLTAGIALAGFMAWGAATLPAAAAHAAGWTGHTLAPERGPGAAWR